MAIKIRCSECNKKVSIDEAFAGGMCRCPYCKAIVYVPEGSGKGDGTARPDAPQARPAAPTEGAEAPAPALTEADHEHIPMARPVKIQGIITLILLGLLILMVGGGVFLALKFIPSGPVAPPQDYDGATSPLDVKVGENKAGLSDVEIVAGPVIYLIDGGGNMRNTLDPAGVLVRKSIVSLAKRGLKFNLLLAREDENKLLAEDYLAGGEGGSDTTRDFLMVIQATGATDLAAALKAALERKPATIVLVASKPVTDALPVAEEAAKQGVVIHTVEIWTDFPDPEATESLKKVAEVTQGKSRSYSTSQL